MKVSGKMIFLSAFFALVLLAGRAGAADLKIAYVDLAKIFDNYEKTKAYDKTLEAGNVKFQEERNAKIDKIKELQGKAALLKDEEKKKAEAEIEKQKNEVLEFDRAQRTDLTKVRDEKVREILLEIEKTVSEHAKKEGISFVLNNRILVYGQDTADITDPVLKKLNDAYKAPKK